jgi:hypothetical protein
MIRSFKDRKTQRFFEGHHVAEFQGFVVSRIWTARSLFRIWLICRVTV